MNVAQFLSEAKKFSAKDFPVFDGDGTPLKAIHLSPATSSLDLYFTNNSLSPAQETKGFIVCQTLAEVVDCLSKLVADPGKIETQASYPILFWDIAQFHQGYSIDDIELVFDEDGNYFDVY